MTNRTGARTYFLYDGLGSTADLTGGSGNTTATYSYDVFGAIRSQTGSSPNYWLFTGEQRDGASSLYYLRARYYDPAIGRFLGRDPLNIGNRYSYVSNNPANLVDPLGLCGWRDPWNCVDDALEAAACAQNPLCIATEAAGLIPDCDAFEVNGPTASCQLVATCVANLLIECGWVIHARDKAEGETATRFPEGAPDSSPGNRFLHCYWSGLVALVLGEDKAERYTTRYEATEDNEPHLREFDLRSNELGRNIAEEIHTRFGPFNDPTKYGGAFAKLSDLCYAARNKE